jgi:hypothetical protein
MTTRYFLATDSRGTTFKRSSATRGYSHCVAIWQTRRALTEAERAEFSWWREQDKAASEGYARAEWSLTLAAAQRNANRKHGWWRSTATTEIVEAREVDRKTYETSGGRQ